MKKMNGAIFQIKYANILFIVFKLWLLCNFISNSELGLHKNTKHRHVKKEETSDACDQLGQRKRLKFKLRSGSLNFSKNKNNQKALQIKK